MNHPGEAKFRKWRSLKPEIEIHTQQKARQPDQEELLLCPGPISGEHAPIPRNYVGQILATSYETSWIVAENSTAVMIQ